jgi:hypothetical protein
MWLSRFTISVDQLSFAYSTYLPYDRNTNTIPYRLRYWANTGVKMTDGYVGNNHTCGKKSLITGTTVK